MSPDLKKIFGKGVVPSTEAAKVFDITNDYVTQLCRRGKISGFLIGRLWFVEKKSLKLFLHESKVARAAQRRALSQQWLESYRASSAPVSV